MRVPDEAGVGMAKVTFSFDSWKEGKVASSTVELPVAPPEKSKEGDGK